MKNRFGKRVEFVGKQLEDLKNMGYVLNVENGGGWCCIKSKGKDFQSWMTQIETDY